ncbi:uncharacterized protein LOC123903894 [Trifolium pratense]|uniref:uncharacterized protein LOC123903894 n=1 Tax=Trifolium pratense TaxID=57577 RepID=UPI001E6930BC|nr:uncharacterized protein LOC123903894 [Trifolium pratense]
MSMDSTAGSVNEPPSNNQNKGYQNDTLNPYFLHLNENPGNVLVYQGDVFRISDIQEEIYTLKQGDCTISAYYTKVKKLWQELDNFRPIPDSNCLENCQATAKMREYRDGDQVIRFFKGLNEQYSAVRSQIMMMEPLPNIGKVYSLLVQQERQAIIPLDESKILASTTSQYAGRSQSNRGRGGRVNGGRGRGRNSNSKYGTYCGMTNHIVENCFKNHGFPPHMQHNGMVNNCATTNEDDAKSIAYDDEVGDTDSGKLFFTPDQHKALLALLQHSSTLQSHSVNHITSQPSSSSGYKLNEDDWCR